MVVDTGLRPRHIVFDLPPDPPSHRGLGFSRNRRSAKTHAYRPKKWNVWKEKAIKIVKEQLALQDRSKQFPLGHLAVFIDVNLSYRGDIDNIAKVVLDALEDGGVCEDDRYVEQLLITRGAADLDATRVTVEAVGRRRPCKRCKDSTHKNRRRYPLWADKR